MDKLEKVTNGLECCQKKVCIYDDTLKECPYWELCGRHEDAFEDCTKVLAKDALALIKAQEPNEDWISRKRLKDEIQYYIDEAGWGDEANKVLGWCMEFIDNQMAVKWE